MGTTLAHASLNVIATLGAIAFVKLAISRSVDPIVDLTASPMHSKPGATSQTIIGLILCNFSVVSLLVNQQVRTNIQNIISMT